MTAVRKRLSDQPAPFKPDWPLVDAVQAQLLAAIRSGDWSAFEAASVASRAMPSPVVRAAATAPP